MKSVQDIVGKYKRGVTNGGGNYKTGVQAVREAPGAKAARAVDKYARGVTKAVEDGSYVAGCQSVSLAAWQDRAGNVGAKRYTESAADAERGFTAYMEYAAPILAANSAAIQAMPSDSEADMDARMIENVRRMRQLRFTRKR